MSANKKEKIAELELHRKKLATLVGELLRKADDIDQSTKYGQGRLSKDWHNLLASTCQELASLSETVSDMAKLVQSGDLEASQRALLRATDIASHLSERLREIKHASGH